MNNKDKDNNNKDIKVEEVLENNSILKTKAKTKSKPKKKPKNYNVKQTDKTNNKNVYTKWLKEDKLIMLEGWRRDGLSLEQIASKIGINAGTLAKWRVKYEKIGDALKKGREVVDTEVENSLLKRALGYNIFLKKPMKIKKDQYEDEIVYVDEEVHIQGDVGAQIFWLTNRKPETWQNTQKNKVTIAEETSSILKAFSKHLQDNKNNSVDLSSDVAELNEINEDLETTE